MKDQCLTLCLCVLMACALSAQTKEAIIDSLFTELQGESSDTGQVKLLNQLASFYRNINLDSADAYARKCLVLSRKSNLVDFEIKSSYLLGVIRRMQGQKNEALAFNQNSLVLSKQEENWRWVGSNCSAIGNTYSSLGIYDTAMIYYFNAVEAYQKSPFPAKAANVYNNLGNMLYKQNKDKLAIEYLKKALKIYREQDEMGSAAMTLMNLGRREKNDSLALDFFRQSLEIHAANNDLQGMASVNMNIGSHYMRKGQYEAALPYYREGLRVCKEVGHRSKMATAHSSLGKIYYRLEQPLKAIKHYEAALELSELSGFREEEKETYNNLSLLYEQQQDYDKAYQYLKKSRDIGDSLLNKQNLIITSELEAKFDAKQKEVALSLQQLTIEKQKNESNRLLVGGTLLLLAVIAIFQYHYFNQKRKKREALIALEKQQSEAENLRQLDALKTQFFTNISHELQTPLSMIITPLEEALEKSSDDNLVLAHHSSKKLFELVNEILDLSKLEAGQLELQLDSVNPHHLIQRIFHAFTGLAERRKIELQLLNKIEDSLWFRMDAAKFERILNNLLSNAIKFTLPTGRIQLKAETFFKNEKHELQISVADSGIGIPEQDLRKIFNRFYQNEHGKKAGGTGIGLAFSRELAQLFGGTLQVESQPNQGSTFRLKIPIAPLEINSQTEQMVDDLNGKVIPSVVPTHKPLIMEGRRPRILIVEDNPEMSDFLERILRPQYDCQKVYSGAEALNKLNDYEYDLITSDLMMPEMNGLEFRKKLNENKQWRQLPFIMLTASSLETDRLSGFTLGIDDYITKPFNSKELLARIDNLLRNKLEREQFEAREQNNTPVESADHQLVKQAEQIILEHLQEPDFKVTDLAQKMNYSSRQLGRLIKKLTGLSPVNFILEIRLQKAYQYLQNKQFTTVSEVRYQIGIESASYFTTKFKERFGKSPKEFLNSPR